MLAKDAQCSKCRSKRVESSGSRCPKLFAPATLRFLLEVEVCLNKSTKGLDSEKDMGKGETCCSDAPWATACLESRFKALSQMIPLSADSSSAAPSRVPELHAIQTNTPCQWSAQAAWQGSQIDVNFAANGSQANEAHAANS